jgi:hypothetical protein
MEESEKTGLSWSELDKALEEGRINPIINSNGTVSINPDVKLVNLAKDQLPLLGRRYAKVRLEKIIGDSRLDVDSDERIGGKSSILESKLREINALYPQQTSDYWYHVNKGYPLHEALSEIIVGQALAKENVKTVDELTIESFRNRSLRAVINRDGSVEILPKIKQFETEHLKSIGEEHAKERLKKIVDDDYLSVNNSGNIDNHIIRDKKSEIERLYPNQITDGWHHVNKGCPLHEALSEIIVGQALAKEDVKTVDELTIQSFRNNSLRAVVNRDGSVEVLPKIKKFETEHLKRIGAEHAKERLKKIVDDDYLSVNNSGNIDSHIIRDKKSEIESLYPNQITDGWHHVNKGCPLHEALSEIAVGKAIVKENARRNNQGNTPTAVAGNDKVLDFHPVNTPNEHDKIKLAAIVNEKLYGTVESDKLGLKKGAEFKEPSFGQKVTKLVKELIEDARNLISGINKEKTL